MKIVTDSRGNLQKIELKMDFLKDHRKIAEENRRILDEHGIMMIDIMGSVGTGKTSLVEQLVKELKEKYNVVVLNGDLATTIDQDRILQYGVNAIQVNTGKGCHLDALLIRTLLESLDLGNIDIILIENVGNLICPADFPLGSHKRIIVISATEGPYIAVKHPHVFAEMDHIIINKIDLVQATDLDVSNLIQDLKLVNPHAVIYQISCKDCIGISELIEGLLVRHA